MELLIFFAIPAVMILYNVFKGDKKEPTNIPDLKIYEEQLSETKAENALLYASKVNFRSPFSFTRGDGYVFRKHTRKNKIEYYTEGSTSFENEDRIEKTYLENLKVSCSRITQRKKELESESRTHYYYLVTIN
jgi:hypothetical protein